MEVSPVVDAAAASAAVPAGSLAAPISLWSLDVVEKFIFSVSQYEKAASRRYVERMKYRLLLLWEAGP